jgi:anti-sigma regulatory factor (Ser/Thr protein kinase)
VTPGFRVDASGATLAQPTTGTVVANDRVTDELDLTSDPRSIRAARVFLLSIAREVDLPPETVSIAELALSEIVTNAVLHGDPPIRVHVDATSARLEVDVKDASPVHPRADETRLDATGGRGLAIVAAVAGAWGCEPDPDGPGKRIWFTVSA